MSLSLIVGVTQVTHRPRHSSSTKGRYDWLTMPSHPSRERQHPWLRLSLLLRAILTERWHAQAWQRVKVEIPAVLAERST